MKTLNYTDIQSVPQKMRNQLAACSHASEAETIFNNWSDECFIEPRSRAHIWLSA